MGEKNSLDQAIHNEKVCDYLYSANEYNDWVITTAFYSAYHFLLHKIFPLDFDHNGKKTKATSFDNYCEITGKTRNKHRIMRTIVEEHCAPYIAVAYNQLLDNSWSARYAKYQHSLKIAKLSRRRLDEIKIHSTK